MEFEPVSYTHLDVYKRQVPPCVYSLPYGMFTGSSGSEMMLKTVDTALAVEILRFYRDDGCQDQ